jgi:hypothetical protein
MALAAFPYFSHRYHADFDAPSKRFGSVRMPFSSMAAYRDGKKVADACELDRARVTGLAFAFYPQRNQASSGGSATGEFYLSIANVKAYRRRDEPEFVCVEISCGNTS